MKTKSHIRYKTKDGVRCVGVTTVTGELGWSKQQLIIWANRLGLKGIDSTKYRDDKADIGTIAHGLILEHHGGDKFDKDEYAPKQVSQAENSLLSYLSWLKGKDLKPLLLEKPLISEEFHFGGTPDNYCELDGMLTLLDYKTGKGIYPEHFIQVAGGYRRLLEENGYPVEQVCILNVPRTEDESFQYKQVKQIEVCWQIFEKALGIYWLKKKLEK